MDAQADLGLSCPHMSEDAFSNDAAHLMMNTVRRCPTDTRKAENGIEKQKIASRVKAGIVFSDEIMVASTAFRIFFAF